MNKKTLFYVISILIKRLLYLTSQKLGRVKPPGVGTQHLLGNGSKPAISVGDITGHSYVQSHPWDTHSQARSHSCHARKLIKPQNYWYLTSIFMESHLCVEQFCKAVMIFYSQQTSLKHLLTCSTVWILAETSACS